MMLSQVAVAAGELERARAEVGADLRRLNSQRT